jgi:hypothetical protein
MLVLISLLLLVFAVPVFAHTAPPCSTGTGQGYAQHHIVPLAQAGNLGEGGHMPGAHAGFSLCNPSGN